MSDLLQSLRQVAKSQGVDVPFKQYQDQTETLIYPCASKLTIDRQTWNRAIKGQNLPVVIVDNHRTAPFHAGGDIYMPPFYFQLTSPISEQGRLWICIKGFLWMVVCILAAWMAVIKRPV